MTLIALSASYGAGGSQVGPELARRLDVPFVDRAIPAEVAERLAVPLDDALAHDEALSGLLDRLFLRFAPAAQLYGAAGALPPEALQDEDYRDATEQVIREVAGKGAGVILGRGATVVLRDDPRVLRVRLDGPVERRVEQAMRIERADRETAERHQRETDRARDLYIHHYYRADPRDLSLYHVMIDSTAIGLDAVTDIICLAARSHPPDTAAQGG